MRVSIFGLGYVGAVSAACLADRGHVVTGVDPNTDKVELINSGRAPVVEAQLGELTRRAVTCKRLRATTDALAAVLDSDITFVCVPTPSQTNGNLDLRYVEKVCAEIGAALREKRDFHVVVVRSTVLPGTLKGLAVPTLERASGRRAGEDFGVCHNPEFLRESPAVADFRNPPKTVIGTTDSRSADIVQGLLRGTARTRDPLRGGNQRDGEICRQCLARDSKSAFANEVGKICKALGDRQSRGHGCVLPAIAKLNHLAVLPQSGFRLRRLVPAEGHARHRLSRAQSDSRRRCLNSLISRISEQIERAVAWVLAARHSVDRSARLCSFKAGTDDLRESPLIIVIERLIGKGFDLRHLRPQCQALEARRAPTASTS